MNMQPLTQYEVEAIERAKRDHAASERQRMTDAAIDLYAEMDAITDTAIARGQWYGDEQAWCQQLAQAGEIVQRRADDLYDRQYGDDYADLLDTQECARW